MAITNKAINLLQLDQELGSKGLNGDFSDAENKVIIPADGSDVTEAELKAAIAAHIAIDKVADDKAALLAKLGITAEEAKLLLS